MTPEAEKVVHTTSLIAALTAALLSPIPFADEVALPPIWALMALKLARLSERRALTFKELLRVAGPVLAARAVGNLATSWIPGVAAAVNAVTAAAATNHVGHCVDAELVGQAARDAEVNVPAGATA
jgi:uncharacterized protein (DUF697 family)